MSFLEGFIKSTEREIAEAKSKRTIADLKGMVRDAPAVRSFGGALSEEFGLIAEVKKRSPSGGEMRRENFEKAPEVYARSLAVKAMSVLTNATHFGMGIEELARIRRLTDKPLLRKDFIFDEYQVYEARAFGADAILLMASVLDKETMKELFRVAGELGMDALFEVHDLDEIEKVPAGARVYGVNSRNFKGAEGWDKLQTPNFKLQKQSTVQTSKEQSDPTVELETFSLVRSLPKGAVKVAESGVKAGEVARVWEIGYDAVLVGTSLLKHPGGIHEAMSEFEKVLKTLKR